MNTIWNLPQVQLLPFEEIVDDRPVTLVYSGPAWNVVRNKLHVNIVSEIEIKEATLTAWDQALSKVKGDVIYAVGGGLPNDAAKYLGVNLKLPVTSLPTALSVDAFFTWASGIRSNGCVQYIETKVPELAIVDLDVIAAAPPTIRAAGICDVLSIATGSWDWRYAEQKGQNPTFMRLLPWAEKMATDILHTVIDCAEAAGCGDHQGLKLLLDCLELEVQLCNQLGHARPEEGSEHYFAYAVENETGPGWPHGDLLGPGLLIMMTAQGQDVHDVRKALQDTHIPFNRIPLETIQKTLLDLPLYCQKHGLPYGIAHEMTHNVVNKLDFDAILSGL
jgi:glycerol-1-phosphate dehydrogenase [NAD(P)+]